MILEQQFRLQFWLLGPLTVVWALRNMENFAEMSSISYTICILYYCPDKQSISEMHIQ